MTEPKKLDIQGPEKLPETDFDCSRHGGYRGHALKMSLLGRARVCDPPAPNARRRKPTSRKGMSATGSTRCGMNIDKMYWGKDFDTFEAHGPELKKHLDTARRFAEKPEGKLVMLGNNGAGKTHLAASILQRTGGIFYTAYEIGVNLRHSYNGSTREKDVLDELCSVNVLVIDEIGRTKEGSDADVRWISHVINKRHANFMPLVLVSNRHMRKDCENERGCPKCLENFFDTDVISRLFEDGVAMKFTGADYRIKIRGGR